MKTQQWPHVLAAICSVITLVIVLLVATHQYSGGFQTHHEADLEAQATDLKLGAIEMQITGINSHVDSIDRQLATLTTMLLNNKLNKLAKLHKAGSSNDQLATGKINPENMPVMKIVPEDFFPLFTNSTNTMPATESVDHLTSKQALPQDAWANKPREQWPRDPMGAPVPPGAPTGYPPAQDPNIAGGPGGGAGPGAVNVGVGVGGVGVGAIHNLAGGLR